MIHFKVLFWVSVAITGIGIGLFSLGYRRYKAKSFENSSDFLGFAAIFLAVAYSLLVIHLFIY